MEVENRPRAGCPRRPTRWLPYLMSRVVQKSSSPTPRPSHPSNSPPPSQSIVSEQPERFFVSECVREQVRAPWGEEVKQKTDRSASREPGSGDVFEMEGADGHACAIRRPLVDLRSLPPRPFPTPDTWYEAPQLPHHLLSSYPQPAGVTRARPRWVFCRTWPSRSQVFLHCDQEVPYCSQVRAYVCMWLRCGQSVRGAVHSKTQKGQRG